jgi:hypothetical protein
MVPRPCSEHLIHQNKFIPEVCARTQRLGTFLSSQLYQDIPAWCQQLLLSPVFPSILSSVLQSFTPSPLPHSQGTWTIQGSKALLRDKLAKFLFLSHTLGFSKIGLCRIPFLRCLLTKCSLHEIWPAGLGPQEVWLTQHSLALEHQLARGLQHPGHVL